MTQLKFIFTGTPGAGKTTAIAAISDFPPVSTDAFATDDLMDVKEHTTVAMDFGELTLESGERIGLYGTPGQERFRHMWEILIKGGLGLIILVDNSRPNPLADLKIYLDNFRQFINQTGAVIGITRADIDTRVSLQDYQQVLDKEGFVLPIFEADARSKEDVLLLLDMLMAVVEMNQPNINVEDDNEQHDSLLSF
jgi:signal recognition particle receptor subunit beta